MNWISSYEKKIFEMSHRMNCLGLPMDMELVHKFNEIVEWEKERMNNVCQKEIELKLTQTAKLTAYFKGKIPNLQADTLEEYGRKEGLFTEEEKKILIYRKSVNSKAVAKLPAIIRAQVNNRLRYQLRTFANITGRWAGALVQPMNFKKPEQRFKKLLGFHKIYDYDSLQNILGDDLIEYIGSCMRQTIAAPPGKTLFSGDYSNIEARLVFWAAEEHGGLQAYREKRDLYVELASIIFNKPISEISKDSIERFCGKQAVLGSGFGIGPPKFQATCLTYGVEILSELSELCVKTYRETYPKVKKMWYAMGKAARKALTGVPTHCGPFYFFAKDNVLYNRLPSGRHLVYPGMRYGDGIISAQPVTGLFYQKRLSGGYTETYTYGAKLFENGIQAISFDIAANGMIGLDEWGFPPILNIHDQAISEVLPTQNIKIFQSILETKPKWLDNNFPLETECEVCENYG